MAKESLQVRYIRALELRGERLVKITSKFRVYTRTTVILDGRAEIPGQHYYVGVAGSLRKGATVASSVPLSQKAKDKLLA